MQEKNRKRWRIFLMIAIVLLLLAALGVGGYGVYSYLQEKEVQKEPSNNEKVPTPTPEEPVMTLNDPIIMAELETKIIDNYLLLPYIPSGKTKDFADWQKIVLTISRYEKDIVKPVSFGVDGFVAATTVWSKAQDLFGPEVDYKDDKYPEFQNRLFEFATEIEYQEGIYTLINEYAGHGVGVGYYPVPYKLTQQGDIYRLYVYRVFRQLDDIFPIGESEFTSDVDGENVILDLAGTKYEVPYPEMGENVNGYKITDEELKEEVKKVGSSSENMRTDIYTFQKVGENFYWTEYQENLK